MTARKAGLVYAGPNAHPDIRVEVYANTVRLIVDNRYVVNLDPSEAAELASRIRRAHQRIVPLPLKRSA